MTATGPPHPPSDPQFKGRNYSINYMPEDRPWTVLEFPQKGGNFVGLWSASLCYNALSPSRYKQFQDFNVTLSSRAGRKEPTTQSKDATSGKEFDTNEVLRQLAVHSSSASTDERGILDLDWQALQTVLDDAKAQFRPNLTDSYSGESFIEGPRGYRRQYGQTSAEPWIIDAAITMTEANTKQLYLCTTATGYNLYTTTSIVSAALSSVFDDAMRASSSPALAMQAYFTSALRIAYYAWLPLFDVLGNSTTISYVDRPVPTSRRGFWAVMAITILHIAVCAFTLFAFLTATKYSMVGNIWAVFSQVAQAEEAQPMLQEGTTRTDTEMTQIFKSNGGLKQRSRFKLVAQDGVVAFAPVGEGAAED